MTKVVPFILLLSWFPVADGVRIEPSPKLYPSPFLPIRLKIEINTKLFGLTIEVYFVVVSSCDFPIVTARSRANLDAADSDGKLKHFSPDFDLIGVLIFIDFQDGDLSLSDEEDDGDGGLVSS